jgi:hypothetical protein
MSPKARFWTVALGAGALSAVLYLTLTIGSLGAMVFAYVAQLPLFLVGLSLGAGASAIAAGVTAIVMLANGGPAFSAVFSAMFLLPVVVLVRQALLSRTAGDGSTEWYPPGLLAGWLTGIGAGLLAVIAVLMEFYGGLEGQARAIAGQFYDIIVAGAGAKGSAVDRAGAVERMAAFMPGTAVASLLCMTVVNGSLAQGVLQRFGWNSRPLADIAQLDLPMQVVWGFGLALVAGMLLPGDFGYLARNMAAVILVGGLLAGLGVAHAAVRKLGGKPWMLVLLYTMSLVLFWPLLVLAVVGLLEPFVGLKRRLVRQA